MLIFCNNVNLRSLLQNAFAVIVILTIWIKRRTGFDFSSFCHMHNLLRIGYVDALAVEHVVKLLLSLVKHGPIVVGFDPYAHHKVDAAVGQGFYSHKRLVGIGRLKYARVGGKECEHLLAHSVYVLPIINAYEPLHTAGVLTRVVDHYRGAERAVGYVHYLVVVGGEYGVKYLYLTHVAKGALCLNEVAHAIGLEQ